MLDIKLFRENPDIIRESEKKRFRSIENVEKVIEYDNKWRDVLQKLQELRAERNKISKSFKVVSKTNPEKLQELKERSSEIKMKYQSLNR